jgi:hypothetical protein
LQVRGFSDDTFVMTEVHYRASKISWNDRILDAVCPSVSATGESTTGMTARHGLNYVNFEGSQIAPLVDLAELLHTNISMVTVQEVLKALP